MKDNAPYQISRNHIFYNGTWMSRQQYKNVKKAERMVMCKWR